MSKSMTKLVGRYEQDEVAQLLLVVEQLEISADLLLSDSEAKARSALILLDNLAEILLRRRTEACFRHGQRRGYGSGSRAFTSGEQKRIRAKFWA